MQKLCPVIECRSGRPAASWNKFKFNLEYGGYLQDMEGGGRIKGEW